MSDHGFKEPLSELYQGEVIGEVLFDAMLKHTNDAETTYKIATMLQLETETKAMLRPIAVALGVDIAEASDSRRIGTEFAQAVAGKTWREAMAFIRDAGAPYLARYREFARTAPDAYKELAKYMVAHEQSLHDAFVAEAAGSKGGHFDAIAKQLKFPIAPPSRKAA